MCNRCLLVFLAGAAAFHAISHIVLAFSGLLPLTVWGITLTQNLNYVAIGGSILLCLFLLYLARDKRCDCGI
jgi:hypothetical protein